MFQVYCYFIVIIMVYSSKKKNQKITVRVKEILIKIFKKGLKDLTFL